MQNSRISQAGFPAVIVLVTGFLILLCFLAGLVAHNSFVHAFVELGLFGGTFFFGCFFFTALSDSAVM